MTTLEHWKDGEMIEEYCFGITGIYASNRLKQRN